MRRSGKSTLFDLYAQELLHMGVTSKQIQIIRLEELENIVYLELLRRGYNVYVGKVDTRDKDGKSKSLKIDFVAENENGIEYYQVSDTVLDNNVLQRELTPLNAVRDHYPKFILTGDYGVFDYNGIKRLNVLEWLLDK